MPGFALSSLSHYFFSFFLEGGRFYALVGVYPVSEIVFEVWIASFCGYLDTISHKTLLRFVLNK